MSEDQSGRGDVGKKGENGAHPPHNGANLLNARQQRAIYALLSERSLEQAARTAKVDRKTLYNWLADPGFKAAYRQVCRTAMDEAMSRLQASYGKAVATLEEVLNAGDDVIYAKVTAARAILEQATKARMVDELEDRVEALEKALDGQHAA